ncbi:MAG: ATP-binding protein [Candidatus Endonucleobacter bathymodioli]|uniref:ATP-binding protein n=1 Tax=Candidatus Endonucleibacter bathymodioli TaxID=539814 RepID=A0AA90SLH3_9GAMM|nr:ATP-binding protein [Candidatus Endonucleobacter bathymodioli]
MELEKQDSSQSQQLKIEVDSTLSNTVMAAVAVRGVCEWARLALDVVNHIELCLVEALNNTIEHAYNDEPGNTVEIIIKKSQSVISLTVSDWGSVMPDDKLSVPVSETEVAGEMESVDNLKASGRGLFIIRSLMSNVQYYSKNGKNSFYMEMTI